MAAVRQAHTSTHKQKKKKRNESEAFLNRLSALIDRIQRDRDILREEKETSVSVFGKKKKTRRGVRLNKERESESRAKAAVLCFMLCAVVSPFAAPSSRAVQFFFSFQSNGCLCACSAAYTHTKIKKRNKIQTLTTLHVECISILYLRKRSTPLFWFTYFLFPQNREAEAEESLFFFFRTLLSIDSALCAWQREGLAVGTRSFFFYCLVFVVFITLRDHPRHLFCFPFSFLANYHLSCILLSFHFDFFILNSFFFFLFNVVSFFLVTCWTQPQPLKVICLLFSSFFFFRTV